MIFTASSAVVLKLILFHINWREKYIGALYKGNLIWFYIKIFPSSPSFRDGNYNCSWLPGSLSSPGSHQQAIFEWAWHSASLSPGGKQCMSKEQSYHLHLMQPFRWPGAHNLSPHLTAEDFPTFVSLCHARISQRDASISSPAAHDTFSASARRGVLRTAAGILHS